MSLAPSPARPLVPSLSAGCFGGGSGGTTDLCRRRVNSRVGLCVLLLLLWWVMAAAVKRISEPRLSPRQGWSSERLRQADGCWSSLAAQAGELLVPVPGRRGGGGVQDLGFGPPASSPSRRRALRRFRQACEVGSRSLADPLFRRVLFLVALGGGKNGMSRATWWFSTGFVEGGRRIRSGGPVPVMDGGGSGMRGVPGTAPADDPQRRRSFGAILEVSKARLRDDAPPVHGVVESRLLRRRALGRPVRRGLGVEDVRQRRSEGADPIFCFFKVFFVVVLCTCPFCVCVVCSPLCTCNFYE